MTGIQNFIEYADDFIGHSLLAATQSHDAWLIADTSSAGTPTYVRGGVGGAATLTLDTQAEAENVCLYHGDDLNFDIDDIDHIEVRVKQEQATIDSTSQISFGLASARNDDIDLIAHAALFRLVGSNAIVVETDDAVLNNDDVATAEVLTSSYRKFVISFASGVKDVRFFVDGARVAASTTFDMSNYTGALQPLLQIQKTSDTNGDGVSIDYVKIVSRRS